MENITIEIAKIVQELEKAMQRENIARPPKIHRVVHHLRNRQHVAKYYSPKLVSFGPIHHNEPNLKLREQYKLIWTAMYVEDSHRSHKHLYQKIADNIKELKLLYTEDVIQHFDEKNLVKMLFVDGCSLLKIMGKAELFKPGELKVNRNQLVLAYQDMLLLENQLPFKVLKLLSNDNEANLIKTMDKFLCYSHKFSHGERRRLPRDEEWAVNNVYDSPPWPPYLPAHLLDLMRMSMLRDFHLTSSISRFDHLPAKYKNIKDLRAAGIRVKQSNNCCQLGIDFSPNFFGGELRIPRIVVDDSSASTYLNLIAYEMCLDFENKLEINSYVQFLDSLIDDPYDIKELRSSGILYNALGSNENVAKLFNIIGADLVPDTNVYAKLRNEIRGYYSQRKFQMWFAEAYDTYFKSPWTIIATLTAFLVLILTFIQTWFAIYPSEDSIRYSSL